MSVRAASVTSVIALDAAARALADDREAAVRLLRALASDHAGIVAASLDSNADDEHDPEGSTIAFERSQVAAMVEATRHRLVEVDAALARIDDGTYGRCEVCGGAIPAGRLEARPTARTCVSCS